MDPSFIWSDAGSGGFYGFSCYRADLNESASTPPNKFSIGHFGYGSNTYGPPSNTIWAISLSDPDKESEILQPPASFTKMWSTNYEDSGIDQAGSFWQVNCPSGYGALSDLCQLGESEPSKSEIFCIKEDYLEDDLHNSDIWKPILAGFAVDPNVMGGLISKLSRFLIGVMAPRDTPYKREGLKMIKSEFMGKLDLNIKPIEFSYLKIF